jgi:hypothetical protein
MSNMAPVRRALSADTIAPPEPDPLVALLTQILSVQRQILSTLQQQRPIGPLSRADRVVLARMLPAVSGVYGPETFSARDLAEDDRPAVRLVVQGRSVKQIGKLLSRADGIAIDGLMLQRQGLEYQVTTWQIVAC